MAAIQLSMWIIWTSSALIMAAAAASIASVIKSSRSGPRTRIRLFLVIGLVVGTTALGVVWESCVWHVFAGQAGEFKGMIAHPRPNYVDSDYTPKGRYYEKWGFEVPAATVVVALILIAVAGSIVLRKFSRIALVGLWSSVTACGGLFLLLTAYKYLIAVDFFI